MVEPIKFLINENILNKMKKFYDSQMVPFESENREFDSCLQFFTNQIAQNVDYINAFEFFYCQICENKCTNMG